MQTEAATNANYMVKNIEVVAKGVDVQARIFTLAPGEVIPRHRHSAKYRSLLCTTWHAHH